MIRVISPIGAIALALALTNIKVDRVALNALTLTLMWVTLAHCWNILGGYTGYLNFGQTAFVGVGAYSAGILITRLQTPFTLSQAFTAALTIGVLLALVAGWAALRLHGVLFALATFAVLALMHEITRSLVVPNTLFLNSMTDIYGLMVGLSILTLLISIWAYRSQFGLMLRAIREDETGASARGVNTLVIKLVAFIFVGGTAALVGAAWALWQGIVTPGSAFSDERIALVIAIVLMGGVGRPWGPVIGGLIYFVVQYFVPTPEIQLMLAGVSILGVVFVFPGGILGQLEKIPVFRSIANNAPELPPLSQERISELLVNTDEVAIVLEGREISHDFGGLRAVNKVSFSVLRGEIVGLLGPNGAGKSTLFDCISGILKPTSGEIFLNGQDITRLSTWKVNHYGLARTFEQTRLFDGLTVYENMLLARKWRNVPLSIWILGEPKAVRQRANDLLTLLGIGHIRQRLARDLSTSEQRLLEIAMALMSEPSIILLDEIAAGIPLSTANELKTTLRRLNRDFGLTFFIVEHNMSFAVDLCDRVYVLDHGSIVAAGMPQDMLREPAVADAYYGHE